MGKFLQGMLQRREYYRTGNITGRYRPSHFISVFVNQAAGVFSGRLPLRKTRLFIPISQKNGPAFASPLFHRLIISNIPGYISNNSRLYL